MSFSGIKDAEISLVGFDETEVLNQIKDRNLIFVKTEEKPKVLDMDFYGNKITFDMTEKCIRLNAVSKMRIQDNPSFYYYYPTKKFKIKNQRPLPPQEDILSE
jgi:hypothetical protein